MIEIEKESDNSSSLENSKAHDSIIQKDREYTKLIENMTDNENNTLYQETLDKMKSFYFSILKQLGSLISILTNLTLILTEYWENNKDTIQSNLDLIINTVSQLLERLFSTNSNNTIDLNFTKCNFYVTNLLKLFANFLSKKKTTI